MLFFSAPARYYNPFPVANSRFYHLFWCNCQGCWADWESSATPIYRYWRVQMCVVGESAQMYAVHNRNCIKFTITIFMLTNTCASTARTRARTFSTVIDLIYVSNHPRVFSIYYWVSASFFSTCIMDCVHRIIYDSRIRVLFFILESNCTNQIFGLCGHKKALGIARQWVAPK